MTQLDEDSKWWFYELAKLHDRIYDGQATHDYSDLGRIQLHILGLLKDAKLLLEEGSHATAVFLAISALEEVAKAVVGLHRSRDPNAKAKQKREILLQHGHKSAIATGFLPAEFAQRLLPVLGKETTARLFDQARRGELGQLRLTALYFEPTSPGVRLPTEAITPKSAREILLFAIDRFIQSLSVFFDDVDAGGQAATLFDAVAVWDPDA